MDSAPGGNTPSEFVVTTLGGLQIRWRGTSVGSALPDKAQALVAYLSDTGRPVLRSEVAGMLWSDLTEERARANLRLALTKIRRVLPDVIGADRRSIWLSVTPEYDVRFVESGDAGETLRRYGGDFLAGVDPDGAELFDGWLQARRQNLRSTALLHLGAASRTSMASEDWTRVIEIAGRILEIESWNEVAHREMMEALANTSGRSAAVAQFEHCERLLADDLGLRPEAETVALAARIDAGRARAAPLVGVDTPGLPRVLTPFLARDDDVAVIVDRLTGHAERLVTLVGPGGVGKTRLSIAAVEHVRDEFEMVVFASLAGVRSVSEAISVVNALVAPGGRGGAEPIEELIRSIGGRRGLVVLDNLEHLADEMADVIVAVLERCPRTTLFATSRQSLDLAVEDVVEVRGLPVPATDADPIDSFGAVRLFVDRAYRIDKAFSLDRENASDIARLCRLVEGVPLLLELAASRVRQFSVAEIVAALESSAALPGVARRGTPPRHASFAAVFDQSWWLLAPPDRTALARLSVTRGGVDRAAAEVLTGSSVAAGSLARRSLLVEEGAGRYRFHELVRQAAAAQLTEPERTDAEVAHAEHYLSLLENAAPELSSWSSAEVADSLAGDIDNFRAAWTRGVHHGLVRRLGAAIDGLSRLFAAAGLAIELSNLLDATADAFADGRLRAQGDVDEAAVLVRLTEQLAPIVNDISADQRCARALALLDGRPERAADRAWVLIHRARSSILRHEVDRAREHLDAAAREAAGLDDPHPLAWVSAQRGRLLTNSGHFEEATVELEDALRVFVETDDPSGQSRLHSYLAPTYAEQYLVWKALGSDRRALELAETLGHRQQFADLNANVGASLILLGDYAAARRHTETALEIVRRTGDLILEGYLLVQWAECLAGTDDVEAEAVMSRGIALEREHNDEYGLIYSLVPWSRLLLHVGRLGEAKLATEELVEVAEARDAEHFAVTARVIGARVDATAGRREQAAEEALHCWDLMSEESLLLPWPIETRLDIVEVAGRRHPVGSLALAEAVDIHRATARSIADPALRHTFMNVLPASRTLAELVDD